MIRAATSKQFRLLVSHNYSDRLVGISARSIKSPLATFDADQDRTVVGEQSRHIHQYVKNSNDNTKCLSLCNTYYYGGNRNAAHVGISRSSLIAVPITSFRASSSRQRPFSTQPSSPSSTDNSASEIFTNGDSSFVQVQDEHDTTEMDVEATLNKLFEESQQPLESGMTDVASNASSSSDAWYATPEVATSIVDWTPVWYNLADQAICFLRFVHETTGMEYGWTIVATTLLLRLTLFPVTVRAQQTTSRMAHLQPELRAMKARFEALGTPTRQEQVQFTDSMKALFARYEVKFSRIMMAPLFNLPLFLGMFFGLKRMPQMFTDEFARGGMLWFPDLTIADPYYLLPVMSSLTFLAVIEIGKENMVAQNPEQGHIFLNVFRVMSLISFPVVVSFEASMLCYWTTNNLCTVAQTAMLHTHAGRKLFGIWEPPKPVPGKGDDASIMGTLNNLQKKIQGLPTTKKEEIKRHNASVDGKKNAMRMVRASRAARRKETNE